MTKISYVLPPNQRTIARFMNLSDWVRWSSKMLGVYHTLSADEQKAFSFLPAYASLIDEFVEAVKCVESIEHTCKHEGLSEMTVLKCKKEIQKYLLGGNLRMRSLGESIIDFLNKEVELMKKGETARNNSSDIIESIFGKYKASKSSSKLDGVTPFILFLPIYTKLKNKEQAKSFNFKAALEETRIGEIDVWANENLPQNMAQVRSKWLKKAG